MGPCSTHAPFPSRWPSALPAVPRGRHSQIPGPSEHPILRAAQCNAEETDLQQHCPRPMGDEALKYEAHQPHSPSKPNSWEVQRHLEIHALSQIGKLVVHLPSNTLEDTDK